MAFSHDAEARLNQLHETIEKNRENLIDHVARGAEEQTDELAVRGNADSTAVRDVPK